MGRDLWPGIPISWPANKGGSWGRSAPAQMTATGRDRRAEVFHINLGLEFGDLSLDPGTLGIDPGLEFGDLDSDGSDDVFPGLAAAS